MGSSYLKPQIQPDQLQPDQPPVETLAEKEWVEKIRAGDPAAFEIVFRTYYSRLCGFVNRFVESTEVAKELVQDLFLSIWNNRREWQLQGTLKSYLYKAAKNRALNYLKHLRIERRYQEDAIASIEEITEDIAKGFEEQEFLTAVQQAIELLPERRRLIFRLHREDGLTYAEIADTLEISIKTVETQMGRALRTAYLPALSFLSFLTELSK